MDASELATTTAAGNPLLTGAYRGMPHAGDRRARHLAADPEAGVDAATRSKLRAKADEFESVFVSQMMAPMFQTVEVDDTFGGGHGEEMFRSFQVNEYAKQVTERGGLGISNQVYRELLRAQETSHGR